MPVRPSFLRPAGLALAAVLVLCVVAPPEALGAGLAAVALFVSVAVVAASASAAASPASRWVLAMVPVAAVATRTAIAPGEAVEPAVGMFLAVIAGISAAYATEHDELFARLFGVLLAYAGGRALWQALWGFAATPAVARETALRGDALGGFLILSIPAVAACAFGRRGSTRALGLAAVVVGAAGLVATRSMPALAALAAALALAALGRRVAPRALAVGAGVVGFTVLCLGIARPDAIFAPAREDESRQLRLGSVRIALEMARDHPLAGVGPGGFVEAFPQYRRAGDDESPHARDLPAELAAEWGLPAGLALAALFFWLFVGPVFRRAGDALTFTSGLSVGLAAFALHNLVGFTAFLPSLLVFAAVCRGLLAQRAAREPAIPAARAAWIAVSLALTVVAMGAGLARDALSDARVAAASGDHAEALRLALRAKTLAPWDADPPLLAAGARTAAGSSAAAALEDAEQAVERAPSRASARSERARTRAAAGDATGAYADLVEASRLYPLRPEYAEQRDALAAALSKASGASLR